MFNKGLFNQQQQQSLGRVFRLGNTPVNGTTIKFEPPSGADTVVRSGTNNITATKLQCICAMKQYENYSMEELRLADYQAGRNKGSISKSSLAFGMVRTMVGGGLFSRNQQSKNASGTNLFKQSTQPSATAYQVHQDTNKTEEKINSVAKPVKTCIQKTEENFQRLQINVDNAGLQARKGDGELQSSNVNTHDHMSLTQQLPFNVQRSNEQWQSQMSIILDKLSHAQQQLLDMQKSIEQMQATNDYLQDQLSLTQQQLLGVQYMMTCSRLWVVSHDQFTIGKEIGRGAWATVYEATFRGSTVAAKCLHDKITSPAVRELFHQEIEMALHCQHHNIVTFLGVTLEDHPVILMELMDISLRNAYKTRNIEHHQVLGIFCDVSKALHFLHTRPDPVIHRDVSSANVLLKAQYNGEWLAKLGDLGTAKIQQHVTTPGPGALAYAAPEVADPKCHSTKMDVYSYGVLVIEVLTKTLPFQNLNALKDQAQQQFPQYYQLVTSCTNQQSSDRPTMYDVIRQLNKIVA